MSPENELVELLKTCVVALCWRDDTKQPVKDSKGDPVSPLVSEGSGVLVSPRHVLTCAHVLGALGATAEGKEVKLFWQREELTGVVRQALPSEHGSDELWDTPDLALLEIEKPPPDLPCAWISLGRPNSDDHHSLSGYADPWQPQLDTPVLPHNAFAAYRDDMNEIKLSLKSMRASKGDSGAPVIHHRTGAVRALVKSAYKPGMEEGVLAVSFHQLVQLRPELYRAMWQENIAYHTKNHTWLDWRKSLPEYNRAEAELALLDRLAKLKSPEDLHVRLSDCVPESAQWRFELRDYWDSAHRLFDLEPRNDEPHPLLIFILNLCQAVARNQSDQAKDLKLCGDEWAELLGQGRPWRDLQRAATDDRKRRPAVAIRINIDQKAHQGGDIRYSYAISEGGKDPHRYNTTGLPRNELEEALKNDLPEPLAWLGAQGGKPTLYLNVPGQLLDLPVEDWSGLLRNKPPEALLGVRFPIVVREHTAPETSRDFHEQRWNAMKDMAPLPLHQVFCKDELMTPGERRRDGWFSEKVAERPGLVLADNSTGLLLSAISSAVPVVLWWRTPCQHSPCDSSIRMLALREELSAVSLEGLPEKVRNLRSAASQQPGSDHCGIGLALVYDDPFIADHLKMKNLPFHSL